MGIVLYSGLIAAALAWVFNSLAVGRLGKSAIFVAAPLIEEALKTGLAVLMGSPVFYTHLTFGLAEAIFDVLRPGMKDLPAGLTGLLSHGIFGWLTQSIWLISGNLWLGFSAALVAHLLWNAGVVFLSPSHKRRRS